jgi:hypothetical protein
MGLTGDVYAPSPNVMQSFNYVGGNAQLGPLADNGGFTLTHLPMAGSPLINAADPAAVGTEDQRGYRDRISGGRMDIGAVEVGARALCDRDADGDCDLADIDAVMMMISQGTAPLAARDEWLASAGAENLPCGGAYTPADFNLDGVTDGSDFGIWNANKFTNSTRWSFGNANGDSVVDGSDFGIWNANKFTSACGTVNCSPARDSTAPVQPHAAARRANLELRERRGRFDVQAPLGGRTQWVMKSAAAAVGVIAPSTPPSTSLVERFGNDRQVPAVNGQDTAYYDLAPATVGARRVDVHFATDHSRTNDDLTVEERRDDPAGLGLLHSLQFGP